MAAAKFSVSNAMIQRRCVAALWILTLTSVATARSDAAAGETAFTDR